MTTYAITGATGHFGSRAIQTLTQLVPANEIVAIARNVEKAKNELPDGITIRQADYDDPATLSTALQGVDKLLLVSSQPGGSVPRQTQHQNVIDAAKQDGVGFIAYTSFAHIETAQSPLADDHRYTEGAIVAAGLKHSFLRNNWYLENEAATIQGALKGQPFVFAADKGRVGWAVEADYADAAAKVLTMDDPQPVYEFAGRPLTYAQLADIVKSVSDVPFEVKAVSEAQYQEGLQSSGLDAQTAAVVTSMQTLINNGDLNEDNTDLPDVLGRPLTPLAEAIKAFK